MNILLINIHLQEEFKVLQVLDLISLQLRIMIMVNKKLRNVGAPASNTDAATKKYVDENSGGGKTSLLTVDSNIDMKDTYRILNLKVPSDAKEPATKNYTDNNFFRKMELLQ